MKHSNNFSAHSLKITISGGENQPKTPGQAFHDIRIDPNVNNRQHTLENTKKQKHYPNKTKPNQNIKQKSPKESPSFTSPLSSAAWIQPTRCRTCHCCCQAKVATSTNNSPRERELSLSLSWVCESRRGGGEVGGVGRGEGGCFFWWVFYEFLVVVLVCLVVLLALFCSFMI